ncbi:MAG: hypothetical protein IPK33_01825 [Gemmatimonadetes bacterium]|nr:hypothetical protein [Gemmatimonadota bacterium]
MRFAPLVVLALLQLPATAHAVPAFARQTGLQCSGCHTQQYPTLNAFGCRFKMDGYTLIGAQGKVEGSRLSLPAFLNASLFFKIRMQKTNGEDGPGERTTNSGELQFPDEFALLIAGRVSENIGFLLEGQLPSNGAAVLAGFKIPFSYNVKGVRASVIPFTTDGLGASYGFELMNTGAVRNIRAMEHREDMSAQQYVGTATAASGATFAVGNHHFFANVTRWSPVHMATAEGRASPMPTSNYARIAWTPDVGGWDLGIGAQKWYGSARLDDGSGRARVEAIGTRAWAVDGQAQGKVGQYPLSLYASVARAAGSGETGDVPNMFNDAPRDRSAVAIASQIGILPTQGASLLLAYRTGDNGAESNHQDRSATVGALYHLHQNVQLQLNYTMRSGNAFTPRPADGNRLLTLMLAAGF